MSDDYTGNGTNCGLGMVYETREEKEIERQRKQITTLRQQVAELEARLSAYREALEEIRDYNCDETYSTKRIKIVARQALAGDTKKE